MAEHAKNHNISKRSDLWLSETGFRREGTDGEEKKKKV